MIVATAAEVIHAYLLAQGRLQITNQANPWWGAVGKKPTSPTNAIVIYDTAGVKDGRVRQGFVIHEGVQIWLRANPYRSGSKRMKEILESLHAAKYTSVTVGTGPTAEQVTLVAFSLTSAIAHLGQETDKVAEMFSMNGTVTLEEVTS